MLEAEGVGDGRCRWWGKKGWGGGGCGVERYRWSSRGIVAVGRGM